MDLKAEAQRVMAVALGKMYSCRLQRGGARLHRSLLLSLVLREAQDVYLGLRSARLPAREEPAAAGMEVEDGGRAADPPGQGIELMDCPAQPLAPAAGTEPQGDSGPQPAQKAAQQRAERGRKRTKGCPEPEGLPSKRARLEGQEEREASPPSPVLGLPIKVAEQPPIWRDRVLGELSMWVRPIVAY